MKKHLKLSLFIASIILGSIGFASESFASTGFSTVSHNATSNQLTDVMCNVLKISTGNAGKAFAAFAIISVGIGFFTGKVSWGLMLGVAAGIAAMFGAPSIVSVISGTSAVNCV